MSLGMLMARVNQQCQLALNKKKDLRYKPSYNQPIKYEEVHHGFIDN